MVAILEGAGGGSGRLISTMMIIIILRKSSKITFVSYTEVKIKLLQLSVFDLEIHCDIF